MRVATLGLALNLATAAIAGGGVPDPSFAARAGLPIVPGQSLGGFLPYSSNGLPFVPLDRDPTEGLRHEWVQTSSGRFGFRMTAFDLPSRLPLHVTLVYDAGMASSLPGIPFQEPRTAYDLGLNWQFAPVSVLVVTGSTTFVLLTDQGGTVPYQKESGGNRFYPAPDRPSEFGRAEPTGDGGYRIELSTGLIRTYRTVPGEGNYWLVKEEDRSGNAITFTYSGGLLQKISSSEGAWVEVFRPLWGEPAPSGTNPKRIVRARDSWGRELRFGFDTYGRMTALTDAAGKTWTMAWDVADHITALSDPLTRDVFVLATSASHKATSVRLFDATTTYSYQSASGGNPAKTIVTAPDGGVWTYEQDAKGNTSKLIDAENGVTSFVRSSITNDLTTITDPSGKQHLLTHDSGHRLTRYEAPADDSAHSAPIWNLSYDSSGRIVRATWPNGGATIIGYDASGRPITEGIDFTGDGTADGTTTFTRDTLTGDVTTITDPTGRVTNYQYTYQRNATTQTLESYTQTVKPPCIGSICPEIRFELAFDSSVQEQVQRTRWPIGSGTWATWETRRTSRGDLKRVVDPLNNTWTISTNDAGQITTVTKPGGALWLFNSRPDGQLLRVEDPLGSVHRWEYDSAGRPVRLIDPEFLTWHYAFDKVGRLKQRTDPEGRVWKTFYDAAGRASSSEAPGSRITSLIRYDSGRLKQRILPGGKVELYDWDVAGNLLTMEQQTPSASGTLVDRWTFTWDRRGLPLSLRQQVAKSPNPADATRSWSWDLAGRVASWTDYGGSTWAIARDTWGRVISIGDGASIAEYEPWSGRVTRQTHAPMNVGEEALDERFEWDAAGRITKLTEYNGSELSRSDRYVLDGQGQILEQFDERAAPALEASYTWDTANRLTSIIQPSGAEQSFTWTRAGLLNARAWRDGLASSGVDRYGYDRSGLPKFAEDPHGLVSFTWDFEPADQSLGYEIVRIGTGQYPRDVRLGFDADGRIESVKTNDNATLVERQRYRWAPGALPLVTARTNRGETGAITGQHAYLTGIEGPASRFTTNLDWHSGLWGATLEADGGGWRSPLRGRGLAERDEGRLSAVALSSGERTLSSLLGGGMFRAGVALPTAFELRAGLDAPGRSTESSRLLAQQFPTADFRDQQFGLPAVPSFQPLTGAMELFRVDWDEVFLSTCRDYYAITGMMDLWCQIALPMDTPKVYKGAQGWDHTGKTHCAGGGCSDPGGGMSWGSPGGDASGRAQAQEPYKSADVHPLGVTLSNGEYVLSAEDARIPGHGIDLAFGRTYRSQSYEPHYLGTSWYASLLDEKIDTPALAGPRWVAGDGVETNLSIPPNFGEVQAQGAINVKVRKFTTGAVPNQKLFWELREGDGTIRRFRDYGIGTLTTQNRPPGRSQLTRLSRPGASVIVIDWLPPVSGCESSPRPLRARLLACDDDAETNPTAASLCRSTAAPPVLATIDPVTGWPTEPAQPDDPIELGRIVFKTTFDCVGGYRVDAAAVKTPAPATPSGLRWSERRIVYSYSESRGNLSDPLPASRHLGEVTAQRLGPTGLVEEQQGVAQYLYAGVPTSAGVDPMLVDNLTEVLAPTAQGSGYESIAAITYRSTTAGDLDVFLHDTVETVTTPSRQVTFSYVPETFPQLADIGAMRRVRFATVSSTDTEWVNGQLVERTRSSVHEFNRWGQPVLVTHADGTSTETSYSGGFGLGDRTLEIERAAPYDPATWISKTEYVYEPCRLGVCPGIPIGVGVHPGSGNSSVEPIWSCYELDYLTSSVHETLGASAGAVKTTCDGIVDGTSRHSEREIRNWMLAAPDGAGTGTVDPALDAYLVRWALKSDDYHPQFLGTAGATATPSWWATAATYGRFPEKGTNPSTGAVDSASASPRPITLYAYTDLGRLTRIDHPDGGQTNLSYHAPGVTASEAGTPTAVGYLAQTEDLDPAPLTTTKPRRVRFAYDEWGTGSERRTLLDQLGPGNAERWIVSEATHDFRGRVTHTRVRDAAGAVEGNEAYTRYDPRGRVCEVQTWHGVDAQGTQDWTLQRYDYAATGLVRAVHLWEKAPLGSGCATAGGSGSYSRTEYLHDDLGNVIQSASRVGTDRWSIDRIEYDLMSRPIRSEAFADEVSATAPPAATAALTGPVAVARTWYDAAGRPVARQSQGARGSALLDRIVTGTATITYDAFSRVGSSRTCLNAAAATSATPPNCERELSRSEVRYDRESRPTATKAYAADIDGVTQSAALVGWSKTIFDERGRVLTTKSAEHPTIPLVVSGNDDCAGCIWRETNIGYDVMDQAVRLATPNQAGSGWIVSKAEFDRLGRKTRVTDPLDNYAEVELNNLGLTVRKTQHESATSRSAGVPSGLETYETDSEFEFDGLGRAIRAKLQSPSQANGAMRLLERTLDRRGNVLTVKLPTDPTYDGSATLADPNAFLSTSTYDGFGRRIASRKHVGQDQTWSDGWLDEAFAFDDGGRLQQITIENGATTGIANQTTQFKYDAQGRRTQRIKPDGREERTIFDLGGRLAKVEHSSALGSQACGAGTTQCVELTRIYDTASRLLELRGRHILGPSAPSSAAQHYRGSSTDILLQSFTLDGLGRAVVTRDVNDPTTTADDGWTHARFDSVGRLTHQGYGGDATAAQWTVASAFDPAGRRTTINTPAFGTAPATTIQTNFDLLGRPTSVIDEHGTNPDETIAGFGFIGFDRLVEQSRGDGTTWQAHDGSQDFFDFATRRTGARITNGAGSILFEEQIRYDQRNEVRAVVWSHGRAGNDSEAQTYAFDELGRLIDFKQGLWDPNANSGVGAIASGDPNLTAARSWQLDVLGNWRAHDPSGDGQGPLQPQLDAINAYTHFPAVVDTDANGSPDTLQHLPLTYDEARGFLFERVEQLSGTTAVKTIEYQHDLLGRLVQVTRKTSGTPTVLAQYGYLADGRLAWRCPGVCDGSGGPRRWLVYDGSQPIHEGTGAAGVAPEWSYVWLGSTLLKATGSSAGERFVHHDRLGSVVMETRFSAGSVQVLGRATYDPYGRPTAIPSWSGASLQVPYGYAGARREDAAGLYLMGARWYDPTLGRFIEQDPIGELGGVNLYAYTGSSPISWTDPSGLYTKGGKNRLAYGQPGNTASAAKGTPLGGHGNASYRTMDRSPSDARMIAKYGIGWYMGSQDSPLYQKIQAMDKMSWRNWSASAVRPAEMSALRGMNGSALAEGGGSSPTGDVDEQLPNFYYYMEVRAEDVPAITEVSTPKRSSSDDEDEDDESQFSYWDQANAGTWRPDNWRAPDSHYDVQVMLAFLCMHVDIGSYFTGVGATRTIIWNVAKKQALKRGFKDVSRWARDVLDRMAARGGVRFAQRAVSSTFRHGEFAGRTIDDVAAGLRSGAINPSQLPIQTITRDGVTYTMNNRSLMALRQAGMEPSVIRDVTGNALFEGQLTQRLGELGGQVGPDFVPIIRGGN